MSDPIRDLAARLARLEREVRASATAPKLPRTSVQNGYTRWMPPGVENPKIFIGQEPDSGSPDVAFIVNDEDGGNLEVYIGTVAGRARVEVRNPDNTDQVLMIADGVMHSPLAACAWQKGSNVTVDASGRPTTTSATYAELWRALLPCTSGKVDSFVDIYPGVGNTCSCRIIGTIWRSGLATQTIIEHTGITTTALLDNGAGPWTVPDFGSPDVTSPIGRVLDLRIEAKLDAGAGPIAVAPRTPVVNAV